MIDAKYGYSFRLFGTDSETKVLGDSAQKYMFILENEKSNPAGIKKSANHEYIFARRHDQILASIGKNITQECLANVQWITRKFANLYLCDDGLPIDKSDRFQKYDEKVSEFLNRDNRMRYTLLKPQSYMILRPVLVMVIKNGALNVSFRIHKKDMTFHLSVMPKFC